jgi:hypothetical protein
MGNTVWQRRRKAAEIAGREAADGGPDRSEEFKALGLDESYHKGRRERESEMQAAQTYESHPLRQISHEASDLYNRTENPEVRELSELIERMADYLLEKEES